jgi:Domain of unknown function (DUF4214)/Protein of unknown function (DUF1565)
MQHTPVQHHRARALLTILIGLLALAATCLVVPAASAAGGRTLSVAPWGSDTATGSETQPYRTITHALKQLRAGDRLLVRGGTYEERVLLSATTTPKGTADAPITVEAYPGEQPVIRGRLKLSGPDHWTIRGIDVTWSTANTSNEHMVQFYGGTSWRFTDAEVWGARSFSAINVDNGASNFRLDHLYVHHTYATNDLNQDHLIYVSRDNQNGIIERNVLAVSPNGRGVKVGPGSLSSPSSDGIVIRYNTFYDNQGPSNVRFSGDSSNNAVYRNIFVRSGAGQAAVTPHELTGLGNNVSDNLAWATDGVVASIPGKLGDGGGNVVADPRLVDPNNGDFRPMNSAAAAYGAHAPGDAGTTSPTSTTAAPTTTTTAAPTTTSAPATTTTTAPRSSKNTPKNTSKNTSKKRGLLTATSAELSSHEAFIRSVTTDFLGRDASAAEIASWTTRLLEGATPEHVARSLAYSGEWVGVLIDGYYQSTLGRAADAGGRQYWTQQIVTGLPPAQAASYFYASDEYFRRAGGTAATWAADLYEEILDRTPDAGGLAHWSGLATRGMSRSAIALDFYQSVESRGDRVDALYEQLLGRPADPAGRSYWIGILANGRDVELATFLASNPEYLDRANARYAATG